MTMPKRFAMLIALSWVALALAGCNTIEGAGKDVKAAGGAVEKAAKSTKTY
jgi:entericidin B